MRKKKTQPNYRRRTLRLPDLDHSKLAVLNSLGSPGSRRVYEHARKRGFVIVRDTGEGAAIRNDLADCSKEIPAGIGLVDEDGVPDRCVGERARSLAKCRTAGRCSRARLGHTRRCYN